jgi:hypothetical protein
MVGTISSVAPRQKLVEIKKGSPGRRAFEEF